MAIEWGPIIAAGIGAASSAATGISGAKLNRKNREWQEKMAAQQREYSTETMNSQNAWNMELWNKENEYNSPTSQVQRLRDAGLNPLFYGLDGSSASALESAQPLGYERAESNFQINPFGEALDAFVKAKGLDNSTKLINAQIDKLQEESSGLRLDNEWKENTMEARAESEQLKNEVLRSDIRLKKQDLRNKVQEFAKLAAETDNEIAKYGYIVAQTALENAMKKKTDEETATIIALRPLEIQLKKAQTQAQKAAASAQYASALYTNGLIESGYIDKQVELIASQCQNYKELAKTQEVQRFMTEFKNSIKSGNLFDFLNGEQPRGKFGQFVSDFGSSFFQFMSIVGEAISTVPGANSAFGAALGGAVGSSSSIPGVADASVVDKQIAAMK